MTRRQTKYCFVCGKPEVEPRLIHLTYGEERRGQDVSLRLVITTEPKDSDMLVCDWCLREIKRIPFSGIASQHPALPDHDVPF